MTCLVFLGFEIDTVKRCIRIHTKNILQLKSLLEFWSIENVKKLESLVDKLNSFNKAVIGRVAFNRIYNNALVGVANPNFKMSISKAVSEDMLM